MLRLNGYYVLLAMFGFIIYFPTFFGGMSLFVGQKILYLLYPCFALCLLFYVLVLGRLVKFDAVSLAMFFIFFVFLIAVLSKMSFINTQIILAHFRYSSYFIIYLGVYNFAFVSRITSKEFEKILLFVGGSVVVFVIVQLVAPDYITILGITNREGVDHLGFRIGGPLVWSYALGFVLMPAILYVMYRLIFRFEFRLFFLLMLLLLIILGGQSKASYLALLLCIGLVMMFSYRLVSVRRGFTLSLIVIGLLILLVGYVVANLEEFGNIARFANAISSGQADASTNTRLSQLSMIQITFENNFLFGYPLYYRVIENAYGYYLYNYGFVGLVLYGIIMTLISVKSWKIFFTVLSSKNSSVSVVLAASMACYSLCPFVFSLANSPLDGHKTAYFFWSCFAAYFGLCARSNLFGLRY